MPHIIIIGGPNGAGKTTAAKRILLDVEHCREFVNADEIARGLSPFDPGSMALAAGKLMISRMRELREAGASFAFETTMASRSFAPFLRECKVRGYFIEACYLVLDSAEDALDRVRHRVSLGGHNVPEPDVRRRFLAGAANFINLYVPLADKWMCYNSKGSDHKLIAFQEKPHSVIVEDEARWIRLLQMALATNA